MSYIISVRLSKEMVDLIDEQCEEQERSRNWVVVKLISEAMEARGVRRRMETGKVVEGENGGRKKKGGGGGNGGGVEASGGAGGGVTVSDPFGGLGSGRGERPGKRERKVDPVVAANKAARAEQVLVDPEAPGEYPEET